MKFNTLLYIFSILLMHNLLLNGTGNVSNSIISYNPLCLNALKPYAPLISEYRLCMPKYPTYTYKKHDSHSSFFFEWLSVTKTLPYYTEEIKDVIARLKDQTKEKIQNFIAEGRCRQIRLKEQEEFKATKQRTILIKQKEEAQKAAVEERRAQRAHQEELEKTNEKNRLEERDRVFSQAEKIKQDPQVARKLKEQEEEAQRLREEKIQEEEERKNSSAKEISIALLQNSINPAVIDLGDRRCNMRVLGTIPNRRLAALHIDTKHNYIAFKALNGKFATLRLYKTNSVVTSVNNKAESVKKLFAEILTYGQSCQTKTNKTITYIERKTEDGFSCSPTGNLAFDSSGEKLLVAQEGKGFQLINSEDFSVIAQLGDSTKITRAVFNSDSSLIGGVEACHSDTNRQNAYLWNAQTGELIRTFNTDRHINAVQFSPDSKMVITMAKSNTSHSYRAQWWNTETGSQENKSLDNLPIKQVEFSSNSKKMLTIEHGDSRDTINIRDPKTGHSLFTKEFEGRISSAAFDPMNDSRIVITNVWRDPKILTYDAKENSLSVINLKDRPRGSSICFASFNGDGTMLLTPFQLGNDTKVILWDAKTGQQIYTLEHGCKIDKAQFDAQGTAVITASYSDADSRIKIWDISGLIIKQFYENGGKVSRLKDKALLVAIHNASKDPEWEGFDAWYNGDTTNKFNQKKFINKSLFVKDIPSTVINALKKIYAKPTS